MPKKLTGKALAKHEAKRNIGEEILQAVREIKAGKEARRYTAASFPIVRAREKSGLSQSEFAALLGVSVRTLQDWEQGRREPSGAAKTLLKIAIRHPEILRELAV
jgi:putative transcriptional regulator